MPKLLLVALLSLLLCASGWATELPPTEVASPTSEPLPSLTDSLASIDSLLTMLENELDLLPPELTRLYEELKESRRLLSEQEGLLRQLEERYNNLVKLYAQSKVARDRAVLERNVIGGIAIGLGVVCGILLVAR